MFERATLRLNEILKGSSWATELAEILSLSALIGFIDTPGKLHIFELTGAVPLRNGCAKV